MRVLKYFLYPIFIFIAIVIGSSKTYAQTGMLEAITISDKEDSGYDIIINADKPASYSLLKIQNNKIIIKLNNLYISNDTDAIYKNPSGLEHVIIKPAFNGSTIEIMGKNAANSILDFPNGTISKGNNPLLRVLGLLLVTIIAIRMKKRKRKEFRSKISIVDEENKILKVAFERKGGLIEKGTGTKNIMVQTQNAKKVPFENTETLREYNVR